MVIKERAKEAAAGNSVEKLAEEIERLKGLHDEINKLHDGRDAFTNEIQDIRDAMLILQKDPGCSFRALTTGRGVGLLFHNDEFIRVIYNYSIQRLNNYDFSKYYIILQFHNFIFFESFQRVE